jgi:hypothetical protein
LFFWLASGSTGGDDNDDVSILDGLTHADVAPVAAVVVVLVNAAVIIIRGGGCCGDCDAAAVVATTPTPIPLFPARFEE